MEILASPTIEKQGWERCQKVVPNLRYLCFKVPEFVLSSFPHYSEYKFGVFEKWCPSKLIYRVGNIARNFVPRCYLYFKVPEFVFPSFSHYFSDKFCGGGDLKLRGTVRMMERSGGGGEKTGGWRKNVRIWKIRETLEGEKGR